MQPHAWRPLQAAKTQPRGAPSTPSGSYGNFSKQTEGQMAGLALAILFHKHSAMYIAAAWEGSLSQGFELCLRWGPKPGDNA